MGTDPKNSCSVSIFCIFVQLKTLKWKALALASFYKLFFKLIKLIQKSALTLGFKKAYVSAVQLRWTAFSTLIIIKQRA